MEIRILGITPIHPQDKTLISILRFYTDALEVELHIKVVFVTHQGAMVLQVACRVRYQILATQCCGECRTAGCNENVSSEFYRMPTSQGHICPST